MGVKAIIYHPSDRFCRQCVQTKAFLKVPNDYLPFTQAEINQLHSRGWSSTPWVRIYQDGVLVDEWSGWNYDKIKFWNDNHERDINLNK